MTALVTGSIREIVPSVRLTTHTAPSPTASALGPLPTGIAGSAAPRAGRSASPCRPPRSRPTPPAPAASAVGSLPSDRRVDAARSMSIRSTAPSCPEATHSAPSGDVNACGELPTSITVARRGCGPGRSARPRRASPSATHSEPPPNASASGLPPTGIRTDRVAVAVDARDRPVELLAIQADRRRPRSRSGAGRRRTAP